MNIYVPRGCTLYKRKSDNRWEARIMINGKQKCVACNKSKTVAHSKLMIAYQEKKSNPIVVNDQGFTLFSWLDQWHRVYRMPKKGIELSENTIISDLSMLRKIKKVFKDKKLRDVTAIYIQDILNTMGNSRTTEGVYTVLKLALNKAKDILGKNIMENVDKPKHERVKGPILNEI